MSSMTTYKLQGTEYWLETIVPPKSKLQMVIRWCRGYRPGIVMWHKKIEVKNGEKSKRS